MRADTSDKVRVLERILASGGSAATCRLHASREWGIGERQTRRLVAMARDRIRADWEVERVDFLAQSLSQLSTIHTQAMASGNLSVALGAITAKAKLCQLL